MRRTTQLTACTITLMALALGGCSDDGSDGPTVSPTSSTSPSPTDPTSPSESTEPSTSPASGPVLDVGSATINLPDGWATRASGLPHTYNGIMRHGAQLRLITVIDLASSSAGYSLDARAEDALSILAGSKVKRQPDVELDGDPAYHITGTTTRGAYEEVGTGSHGRGLSISFDLAGYTAAERREIVDSVIASFSWKE